MNAAEYEKFKVGLDVLHELRTLTAEQVYDLFLEKRAGMMSMDFSAYRPEVRARVRLACLCRRFRKQDADEVMHAFAALDPSRQKKLVSFINADGITERPGLLLYRGPDFLSAVSANKVLTLTSGFRVLLKVYEQAA